MTPTNFYILPDEKITLLTLNIRNIPHSQCFVCVGVSRHAGSEVWKYCTDISFIQTFSIASTKALALEGCLSANFFS